MGYYGKEKEPKGVTASDRSGEKMGSESYRVTGKKGTIPGSN